MRQLSRVWCVSGISLLLALGVSGCECHRALCDRAEPVQAVASVSASAESACGASRPASTSSPIGLFGEFPDSESVPFELRASYSLLQHTDCPEGADFDPAVDPTGGQLAFASTRHTRRPDLYIKTVGGAAVTQITSDPASDIQPEFSPDGKRLVFSSDRTGNFDIWMIGVDGVGATQLTHEPSHDVRPTWAPDGQRIAYCSLNPKSGQWELWMLDLRQPGLRKFVGYGLYPRWSPTEDLIAYQRARQRGQRWFSIWTLRLVQGEPRFPTEISASASEAHILPTFSPDGQKIAFCALCDGGDAAGGNSGRSEIRVINVDGSEPSRLTGGDDSSFSPCWARDGRVYFASNRGGKETIWSVRPGDGDSVVTGAAVEPALDRAVTPNRPSATRTVKGR